MSSLRERLAAKSARRLTLYISTGADPSEAHDAWQRAEVELALSDRDDTTLSERELVALARERDEAKAAYDALFVPVEVQALPAADFEALMTTFALPDPPPVEEGDQVDWDALLPELLAASCVDPDLQDAAWWSEQLAQPAWSQGQKIELRTQIVALNMNVPLRAGKG